MQVDFYFARTGSASGLQLWISILLETLRSAEIVPGPVLHFRASIDEIESLALVADLARKGEILLGTRPRIVCQGEVS